MSNLLCSIDSRFQKMFEGYENSEYGFEEPHLSPDDSEIFGSEIYTMVEISTDFDLLSIVEFQIYRFILRILQTNLGKILAKMLSNCLTCITSFHPNINKKLLKHTVRSLRLLYRRRIRLMFTAVILCFSLLKSENVEVIPPHCGLIT